MSVAVRDAGGRFVREGVVDWKLDNFGRIVFANDKADLAKGNPFTVSGTMKEPGFLRLTVTFGGQKEVWGVGFDVEKIRLVELERPADFDAYWTGEKARLEKAVPLDPRCVLDAKHSTPRTEVYNISFATFGSKRVYGFMSVPRDKSKGPFPTSVYVPGSGVGPNYGKPWGDNVVHVNFSVHMYEPHPDPKAHARLMAEQNLALARKFNIPRPERAYCATAGIGAGRDDYYYHDVMLGINRAIDWLRTRDFIDKDRVTMSGTSQGGYFTLALSYLNGGFARSYAAVPAWSGVLGYKRQWDAGAPNIVQAQAPENRAAAEGNIRYYDGVNFAAGIRTPILFFVGFRDTTCQPPCVYSAFNACSSPDKRIINGFCGHRWMPWFYQKAEGVPTCIDPDKWLSTGEIVPFKVRK